MLLSEQQTGIGASAGIFGNGNSNDAKIRLLERRLRGDTPSPGKLNRVLSIGEVNTNSANMSILLRMLSCLYPYMLLCDVKIAEGTSKPALSLACLVGCIW